MIRTAPMLLVFLVALGGTNYAEDEVTAEQFLRLVKTHQSPIRDVAFAFEGEVRPLGPRGAGAKPSVPFQGRYALRSDGATFLEHYYEGRGDDRDSHVVHAILRGAGEEGTVTRDGAVNQGRGPAKISAGPGSYFSPDSPEAFAFLWRFQTLNSTSDFGYAFLGWEQVDGHRCAHIRFNPHPNSKRSVVKELWVDLERGAHPLRIKNTVRGKTAYDIDQIKLSRFELPSGEEVWFPISGRSTDYVDYTTGTYLPEPTQRITSDILNGAIFFNQGLKDAVFHIRGESFRPSFAPKPAKAAPSPKPRASVGDFEDAERKLDAALADPSRPKGGQDAAASASEEGWRSSLYAWLIGGLGGIALLAAGGIALRRRSSR